MLVVVCEAGEAWHAAGVVVPQSLEQLAQFLLPALLFLQPLLLVLLLPFPATTHRHTEHMSDRTLFHWFCLGTYFCLISLIDYTVITVD